MYNKTAMNELKTLLRKRFPELIDKIILYGSRAENKEKEFSDYDILLILKSNFNRKFESDVFDIAYDLILKYDIITDLKFVTKDELKTVKGILPFVRDALNKGIEL